MKSRREFLKTSLCAGAAAAAMFLAAAAAAHAQISESRPMPAVVTVRVGPAGTERVPDGLFGSFLEPIGNSINGGVVAEILTNGSLESGLWNHSNLEELFRDQPELIDSSDETGIPLPWQPLDRAAGNRFELHVGDAANSWQSLEIMGTPNQQVGIMQRVYLPVQRELGYRVSLYAKHLSGPAGLTVQLRDVETGKTLAESRLDASGAEWTKYSATLRLSPGAVRRLQPVEFAVAVEGTGRVDVDEISVLPEDAIGILDPDEVAMARAMHVTELRLGGNFSSSYHWKDGIGPADKRRTTENIAWGIPEYNQFGTDEFLQLCDLIGAVPQFDLNMGSGTPEEAADWVRYIGAHHKGRVLYELGNELYGRWQVGYKTVDEIAPSTLEFSRAVRAADPNAELIATGLGPVSDGKWNAAQLTNPPGTFDDLSLHFILGTNHPAWDAATPDFTAAAAYALPYAVGPYFDKVEAQVEAHPDLRGKVHLAVTEWLFNSKGCGERNFTDQSPSWMNEGGAVMAAGFLNTLLRHASQVKIADMTGIMEFAGIWKRREQVYAVPAYYVFRMYTAVKGDTILPVSTDSGSYNVAGGVRPLDRVEDIPYIDVVATRSADGKTITLLCVNRSLDQDVPMKIDLGGLHAAAPVQVQQIAAVSRYERNDEVEPNHVVPVPGAISAPGTGPLKITLPHESVTVLRVPVE
ncbi:MAG: alpha-L-arabinofuranosidase C-terminal domain-containing protein [Terracidiphilus sp.]